MSAKPSKRAIKAADAYHHGDLRRALLDAAMAQVEKDGADTISLAALARALGVSQSAPYRHFPDRDALLAAIAVEGFSMFSAALSEAAATRSGRSALTRMAHAYVAFGLARPGLYRLMFDSEILVSKTAGDALKTVALQSFNQLLDAVRPLTASSAAAARRAMKIWVGLHGTVMLAIRNLLGGKPMGRHGIDPLIEDILA